MICPAADIDPQIDVLQSKMKDLITASEFHGPFFYGLSIVKKRS